VIPPPTIDGIGGSSTLSFASSSAIVAGMGRTERRGALAAYVTGLLLDGERKSVEPLSRLVDDPAEIQAIRRATKRRDGAPPRRRRLFVALATSPGERATP
jgi:SRSO17 transposase